MSEPITFDYEGTKYTLEFNRQTAVIAETQYGINIYGGGGTGVTINLSQAPDLFYCALLMHHPRVQRGVADGIFALMTDKVELVSELITMLLETVTSLVDDPSEGNAIGWKRSK